MQIIERDGKLMARVHEAENEAYAAAVAQNSEIGTEELRQRNTLLTQKAELEQKYAEERLARDTVAPPKAVVVRTGAGPTGPTETPEQIEARELKAINDLRLANTKGEQQLELDQMKWDDEQRDAKYEREKAALLSMEEFNQQMLDEHDAEIRARGDLTEQDIIDRNARILQATKDRLGQELGAFMQVTGKELAAGKLTAKSASDYARTQIANVIIGLGDQAMVKGGVYLAELNPLAAPMFAAGALAYTIGNAMMPTKKPNAGETPATEKPADGEKASNNYAFNLRVDSVFADGESVARQFAMMQESARARGLLSQGA